ncbi:MAG: PadR family transcriptional regulator [Candidatus Hadarchaeales archaeon]
MSERWGKHWQRHMAAVPKGFLRYQILELLSKKPMSGVEIMDEIEKITGGTWRPLPGSVYPLLRYLKKNGYARETRTGKDGIKRYELTKEGKKLLERIRSIRSKMMAGFPPFFGPLCMRLPPNKVGEMVKTVKRIAQGVTKAALDEHAEEKIDRILKILEKTAKEIEKI